MKVIKIVTLTIIIFTETLEGCLNRNIPQFSSLGSPTTRGGFDSEKLILSSGLALTCHGQVVSWEAYMEKKGYTYDLIVFQIWRPQSNDSCIYELIGSHRIVDYQVGNNYLVDTSTLTDESLTPIQVEPGDVIGVYIAARENNPSRNERRIGVQQYQNDNTNAWTNQVAPGSIDGITMFDSCSASSITQGAPIVNAVIIEDVIITSPTVQPTVVTTEIPTQPLTSTTASTEATVTTNNLITTAQTTTPATDSTGIATTTRFITEEESSPPSTVTPDVTDILATEVSSPGVGLATEVSSPGVDLSPIIIGITAALLFAILIVLCVLVLLCYFRWMRIQKTERVSHTRTRNLNTTRNLPKIPEGGGEDYELPISTIKRTDMSWTPRQHLEVSNIYETPEDISQMQTTSLDRKIDDMESLKKLRPKGKVKDGENYEVPISTMKRHKTHLDPGAGRHQLEVSNLYETPEDAANRAAASNPCFKDDDDIYEIPVFDAFADRENGNVDDEDYTAMASIWPPTL